MKTVLIFSGGLDSTVLLHHLRDAGHEVQCLSVDYGQRHARELGHAADICDELGIEHEIADLSAVRKLLSGSSQTSPDIAVPDGHYTAQTMKATVVPNRNMLMLALGISWAIAAKCDAVAYAAHNGDHTVYHDCREEFVRAMDAAAHLCDERPIQILRPFVGWSKAEIVERGHQLRVPMEKTWSCYKGRERHCGQCGTCCERREAFALARIPDPTEYESE